MEMTGAKILMECLLEQGVDLVFGYPGGTILNVYDELYHYRDRITHILTAHEQGASHAADGYARSTGKVGVCLATSGPGATNLTTGIATAYMDSSPVVFITCNVSENLIGKDSFQEVDITGACESFTKHSYLVKSVEDLPRVFEKGFTGYNGREDKKSTGIGLYLCRRVMDRLNHGISIVSRPGQGTLVRLDLSRGRRVVE